MKQSLQIVSILIAAGLATSCSSDITPTQGDSLLEQAQKEYPPSAIYNYLSSHNFDSDGDGIPDHIDPCPATPDDDVDGDGVCEKLLADINGDGCVNLADQSILAEEYGKSGTGLQADLVPDGIVNLIDVAVFAQDLGQCQDNCPITPNPDQIDSNDNGVGDLCENDDSSAMLLFSSMDSADRIFEPEFFQAQYSSMSQAIPGLNYLSFEPGHRSMAARFNSTGFTDGRGVATFKGENFDFGDPEDDGGRLDFWIKFNVDPHTTTANTWVARSNYGCCRPINLEFSGSPADFMVDIYSETRHNDRTNYKKFRVSPRNWSVYENIREGEWNLFTILWRRNGGPHKAELHLFINGTQEGCLTCSDYNGNLPSHGSVTDFAFAVPLYGKHILFSIDEVYSFRKWNVSNTSGNFTRISFPDGVMAKYPQENRYPIYGCPVEQSKATNMTFDFQPSLEQKQGSIACDVYIDGLKVGSTTTSHLAHTEFTYPETLSLGEHRYQIKCENNQIQSPETVFRVVETLPLECQ